VTAPLCSQRRCLPRYNETESGMRRPVGSDAGSH
jgi:hypothetical protein